MSQYPSLEGRFAQVAGVTFGFDAQKPPGQRIKPKDVEVQGMTLDLEQVKHLAAEMTMLECVDPENTLPAIKQTVW